VLGIVRGGLTNVPSQFVDVIEPGLELAN